MNPFCRWKHRIRNGGLVATEGIEVSVVTGDIGESAGTKETMVIKETAVTKGM